MPVSAQVERLQRQLAESFGSRFEVLETDLYDLVGPDLEAALDAVVAGEPSPFVLAGGRLVCCGSVEVGPVVEALS